MSYLRNLSIKLYRIYECYANITLYHGILIPLASSQHNLYDIYLLLCVQY